MLKAFKQLQGALYEDIGSESLIGSENLISSDPVGQCGFMLLEATSVGFAVDIFRKLPLSLLSLRCCNWRKIKHP
jgi:hypothetical protein